MRVFVAVPLPDDIKREVAEISRGLAAACLREGARVTWVKPEQFHFTLKFLGECAEDQAPRIIQALETAAKGASPFTAALGGPGCYPERGPLRIIWLGLTEGEAPMVDLAARVEAACGPLGFPKEDRPFSAHLTLGRVKSARSPDKIRSILAATPAPPAGSWKVDSFALVQSVLSPHGPAYTTLQTFHLTSSPAVSGGGSPAYDRRG
ncbi:MAG: 2'-5' RNA ligase [Elusimicrobia bacterium RIFCSPLOWO2_01_FULL_59_12]|nr:MAG: 2'-5' RNA ligase [Elusimicrobia bacterium RIFCSPLOWO2_01_FULL_59_12]